MLRIFFFILPIHVKFLENSKNPEIKKNPGIAVAHIPPVTKRLHASIYIGTSNSNGSSGSASE